MNPRGFLRKQVKASEADGRTTWALRRLVLGAVAHALQTHYGENYSNRCGQSAAAVSRLLSRAGIDNLVVRGEACIGQVVGDRLTWAAFGGMPERNHCWTRTRFGELVDLTVRQHHLAPGMEPGGVPCPALWWNDPSEIPAAFTYLPGPREGRIAVAFSDAEEDAVFRRFLESAKAAFDAAIESRKSLPSFEIVSTIDDLDRLAKVGDAWCAAASRCEHAMLPRWALERHRNLSARARGPLGE